MADSSLLTENFKELRLKTPEEIEKAVVDESLSPVERAIFLLCSGEDVQKLSVLTNLSTLLQNHSDETLRRVLPKIREMVAICSTELHQTSSRVCIEILQKNVLSLDTYIKHFFPMIFTGIDSRDIDVSVLWLDTLFEVVDLLPTEVVTAQILPKAQHFSQSNQPVSAKLTACKLLGKISLRLQNSNQRRKDILPHIKSLGQELEFEVRVAACAQLSIIGKYFTQEEIKELFLSELLELCNDDDFHVRTAGLETLVTLSPQLDTDTLRSDVIPFVLKFFRESIASNSYSLPAISAMIGKVCSAFSTNLNADERQFCIECYKRLCCIGLGAESVTTTKAPASNSSGPYGAKSSPGNAALSIPNSLSSFSSKTAVPLYDAEARPIICRENAASNFPLIVQFCGVPKFRQELRSSFSSLCTDPSPNVRRSIARCFYEVLILLDADGHVITKELSMLLDDNNLDVLEKIIPDFEKIAAVLAKNHFRIPATPDSRPTNSGIILTSLFNCDQTISRTLRWRLHVKLIENFQTLKNVCSSEVIYQRILPALFNRFSSVRPLPLKVACLRTILVLLRNVDQYERWIETFNRLSEDLLHSPNSYRRSLYIDLCHMVLDLYSRAFFKANCLDAALTLAQDPVPNLRIRLCELLLKVKAIIRLPADRKLLQALESAVRKLLLNETDRAVSSVVISTVEKLDKIEVKLVPMGRISLHASNPVESEADLRDAKKEEEERAKQECGDDKTDKKEEKVEKTLSKQASLKSNVSRESSQGSTTSTSQSTAANVRRVRTGKKPGTKEAATSVHSSSVPVNVTYSVSGHDNQPTATSSTASNNSSKAQSTTTSTIGGIRRNSFTKATASKTFEILSDDDEIAEVDEFAIYQKSSLTSFADQQKLKTKTVASNIKAVSKMKMRRKSLPVISCSYSQQILRQNTISNSPGASSEKLGSPKTTGPWPSLATKEKHYPPVNSSGGKVSANEKK